MKPSILMAAVAAFAFVHGTLSRAAPACPSFTIKAEVGKTKFGGDATQEPKAAVRFTVTPTPAGALYNWSVSNGTIIEGQGTAVIVVFAPGLEGQTVTASLDVLGLDAACAKQATVSASAKVE